MSKDLECPNCGEYIEICHDDGFGYEEGTLHEQNCGHCDKNFAFTTSICYYYEGFKADCLNDGEHLYEPTTTFPKMFTKMTCKTCDDTRVPTLDEKLKYDIPEIKYN